MRDSHGHTLRQTDIHTPTPRRTSQRPATHPDYPTAQPLLHKHTTSHPPAHPSTHPSVNPDFPKPRYGSAHDRWTPFTPQSLTAENTLFRHRCYCTRAGLPAYCEPGIVENPSLSSIIINHLGSHQQVRTLFPYPDYFYCVREVYPHFSLCPRWRSAHPFCWRSNQIRPISPARPVAAPARRSLFFKTLLQSARPEPRARPLHPARASHTRRAPDSLNPLVYFPFCPGPRSQPRAIVACLSGVAGGHI